MDDHDNLPMTPMDRMAAGINSSTSPHAAEMLMNTYRLKQIGDLELETLKITGACNASQPVSGRPALAYVVGVVSILMAWYMPNFLWHFTLGMGPVRIFPSGIASVAVLFGGLYTARKIYKR